MAIDTVPVDRAKWTDLVLRMGIPPQRKAVAFALSSFANPDGTRVFPGQGKVADMAGLHETNARKHIRALVDAGMLIVVKRGGGRGGATTTYRLSRPADITSLPLWLDPDMNRVDQGDTEAEEYRASAPGESVGETPEQHASAPAVSVDNSTAAPVDNSETESADARYSSPAGAEIPSVPTRNTERSAQKYRALALPDQPKTNPRPTQHPAGSPNATPLLVLLPQIHNGDEIRIPTDEEFEAARDLLAGLARADTDRWRHAAQAELEAAGIPLEKRTVAVRTAELATRPDEETRHADTA